MVQGQNPDFPVLTRSRRVSPQILQVLQRIDTGGARRTRATSRAQSKLDEATLRTFPEMAEQALGPDHPEFAKVLHRLAVLYHARGNLVKAEFLYRRAWATAEIAFSEPDLELALILNNLGRLLYEQKKSSEAERLYQRSIRVIQDALGPEHPKLATPLSNLASLYWDQGRRELAQSLYKQSIAILEKTFGPEHPKVVKARKKLAAAKLRNPPFVN